MMVIFPKVFNYKCEFIIVATKNTGCPSWAYL